MTSPRLAPLARADLKEIWLRCAQDAGFETADRLITGLTDSFEMLRRMPNAGRARDDIAQGVRSFPHGLYITYYRKAARGRILILRIIHGRRDQRKAWNEPKSHRHRGLL